MIGNSVVIVQSYTSGIKEAGDEARGSWPLYVHLNRWAAVLNYCETVPGYAEALEERRPGATSFSFDFTDPWDPNFVFAPVNVITNNRYINAKGEGEEIIILLSDAADYCTAEDNIGYTLSENPIFVNPTLGDYRIREGVDFPDIHFELIGRY